MDEQHLLAADLSHSVQNNYGVSEERKRAADLKLYGRRWVMLAIVTLLTAENYAQWLFYSAISNIVEYHFNVSSFLAQLLSLGNTAITLVFGLPILFVMNQTDLKTGCLISGLVSLFGLWIKYFGAGQRGFSLTLCGQIVASFGAVFLRPMPVQLASTWFGTSERSAATSITASGFSIGMGFSYLMSVQFVPDCKDHGAIENGIQRATLIQAMICSVTTLATVFVFERKPPSPPSRSQAAVGFKSGLRSPSYLEYMRLIMANRSYKCLVFAFGFTISVSYTVFSLLNEIVLRQYPGKETSLGWMGFLGSTIGIPGMIFAGVWLDWSKSYRNSYVVFTALIALTTLAFTLAIKYSAELWVLFMLVGLYGFLTAALNTLGFVLAGELTYPIPEILSSGIMVIATNLFGVILLATTSYTVTAVSVDFVNWLMSGVCFIAVLFTLFVKSDFRRLAQDVTDLYRT